MSQPQPPPQPPGEPPRGGGHGVPQGPPPQGAQGPYGAPPQPPAGYGFPQGAQPAQPAQPTQPAPGNPYTQPPAQPAPSPAPGYGQTAPYGYGQPPPGQGYAYPAPHGAYPPPPHAPAPGGPGGGPGGPGKRRTGLLAGAAAVALAVVIGGVWLAVGGDEDGSGSTAAKTPSASPEETDAGADPTQPGPEPTSTPTPSETEPEPESTRNPFVPEPTGTGLQAVWKAPDGPMLALGDAYTNEPKRINAIYDAMDGFDCKGRWQKEGSGDELVVALLCEQDGERVKSKDRFGRLSQSGDTLTVKWEQGAEGTDTFERFRDMEED